MVSAYCPSEQMPSRALESTTADVFNRVRDIVFEYHDIDGTWAKLETVKQRLWREGYALHMGRGLVSVSRP
jgi:hypothetical protein